MVSQSIIEISADGSELIAAIDELGNLLQKFPEFAVDSVNFLKNIKAFEVDQSPTSRTGHFFLAFKPSQRFFDLLFALRTGEGKDFLFKTKQIFHGDSFQND
jgi:hypothetical protein